MAQHLIPEAVIPARSPMNPPLRRTLAVGGLSVVTAALLAAPDQAAPSAPGLAPFQDALAGRLDTLDAAAPTTVLVHGTGIAAVRAAVTATGMRLVTEL